MICIQKEKSACKHKSRACLLKKGIAIYLVHLVHVLYRPCLALYLPFFCSSFLDRGNGSTFSLGAWYPLLRMASLAANASVQVSISAVQNLMVQVHASLSPLEDTGSFRHLRAHKTIKATFRGRSSTLWPCEQSSVLSVSATSLAEALRDSML